jgi:hypothetical protein
MSNSTTSQLSSSLTPVGLDISSLFCRVAVGDAIVSNTQGDRWTWGLVAEEEQYVLVDDSNASSNKVKKSTTTTTTTTTSGKKSISHVIGEACIRLSNRSTLKEANDDDARAVLRYLLQLAADKASVPLNRLRVVLTCPSLEDIDRWKNLARLACKTSSKKGEEIVIGVMNKAAAVCVTQLKHWKHNQNVEIENNHEEKINESESLLTKDNYGSILVLDMDGDAPLQWSVLRTVMIHDEINDAAFAVCDSDIVTSISGPSLVSILTNFVVSQFERQYRLPSGEFSTSSRAATRLKHEVHNVLLRRTAKTSPITILLDGLYDGLDCHVTISSPRWDLLAQSWTCQLETMLQSISSRFPQIQYVLWSGAWTSLYLPQLVDQIWPNRRGPLRSPVAEESVALGCAQQAQWILQRKQTPSLPSYPVLPPSMQVPVSPITLILDPPIRGVHGIVRHQTILPARVKYTLTAPTKVYQVVEDAPALNDNHPRISLADISDVIEPTVLMIELNAQGNLCMQINGQPPIVWQL